MIRSMIVASRSFIGSPIVRQSIFNTGQNTLAPLTSLWDRYMKNHASFSSAAFLKLNSEKCGSESPLLHPVWNAIQKRGLTKFSLRKGKRKTVKAVLKRFYRLNWGIWIRTKCGRNKKLHTKSANRKRRLRQHVFTNATQSTLLDKMVTSYWRKPKYYIDDPYEPYHQREEFSITRRKPCVPLN